jgi:hypothetical protein
MSIGDLDSAQYYSYLKDLNKLHIHAKPYKNEY